MNDNFEKYLRYLPAETGLVIVRQFSGLCFVREHWAIPSKNPNQGLGQFNAMLDAEVVAYSTTKSDFRRVWFLQRPAENEILDGTCWPPMANYLSPRALLIDPDSIRLKVQSKLAMPGPACDERILSREREHASAANAHWESRCAANGRQRYRASFPVVEVAAPVLAQAAPRKWYQLWS